MRHNRVRNLVANICREGLLSPVVEMKNLLTSTARRPGDIVLPNWSNGRPLAVDVAVTSPFTINGMKSKSPADSYALAYKYGKYEINFRGLRCLFAALVLETTGAIDAEGLSSF